MVLRVERIRLAVASSPWAVLSGGFVLGLVGRIAWIRLMGTHDADTYLTWGSLVRRFGLAHAYYGIYFPLQWQLFGVTDWLAANAGLAPLTAFKLVVLCFDVGAFALLVMLLRRLGASPLWALVFWLQPYFLAISWLGYVDAQFVFFLLLGITVIAFRPTPSGSLVGGFGLGAALLMKPQAILLVVMVGALAVAALLADRRISTRAQRFALLLVGPMTCLAGYSLYFYEKGEGAAYLARGYMPGRIASASPGLTENMPNIWYPVADSLRAARQPIYAVNGRPLYHQAAEVVALLLLCGVVVWVTRHPSGNSALDLTFALALAAAVVPMIATHAHENHFYAAAVLTIIPLALLRHRVASIAFQVTLLAQFANLVGLYAFGSNGVSRHQPFTWWLDVYHHHATAIVVSLVAWTAFVVYAVALVRAWSARFPSAFAPLRATRSIWPARGLQGSRR